MKIKKKGDKFVAYKEASDSDNPDMNDSIKNGEELGYISISTGNFVGNTVCLVELGKKQDEYVTSLANEVIEQVKSDMNSGDVTVLDEILKYVPIDVLIQSLPEEQWSKYE